MTRTISTTVILIAAALSLGAQQRTGVQLFAERVEAYAELHRHFEKAVAPEEPFIDVAAMLAASDTLRALIREARADAREGSVFAPVAADLPQRIRRALRAHGIEARDLIVEMIQDTEGTPPQVQINEPFSWLHGNLMLACVLEALPPLPTELEYRLVGTHLVLIDVHTNLVVDILRDVLPAMTTR